MIIDHLESLISRNFGSESSSVWNSLVNGLRRLGLKEVKASPGEISKCKKASLFYLPSGVFQAGVCENQSFGVLLVLNSPRKLIREVLAVNDLENVVMRRSKVVYPAVVVNQDNVRRIVSILPSLLRKSIRAANSEKHSADEVLSILRKVAEELKSLPSLDGMKVDVSGASPVSLSVKMKNGVNIFLVKVNPKTYHTLFYFPVRMGRTYYKFDPTPLMRNGAKVAGAIKGIEKVSWDSRQQAAYVDWDGYSSLKDGLSKLIKLLVRD